VVISCSQYSQPADCCKIGPMQLYTIGHSNHPPEKFIKLLQDSQISCIVDVRSKPYSRWVPCANRENMEKLLASIDIQYRYLGSLLGGLIPDLKSMKMADRLAAYSLVRHEGYFKGGIDRLIEEIKKQRTCVLCAEEDPSNCHRRLLVGASIAENGIQISHIRGDGRIQVEEDIWKEKHRIDPSQISFST
jgi:uncharacterized protein (DUF488 family)